MPKAPLQSPQNAPQLPLDRLAGTPEARRVVEGLFDRLAFSGDRKRALKVADRGRLRATLEAMACALYVASCGGGWLRYGRGKRDYDGGGRYDRSGVTHTTACRVADWLQAEGLAEGQLGHFQRNPFGGSGGTGLKSRLRATGGLLREFGREGVTPAHIGWAAWSETIILRAAPAERGGGKPLADYADTGETRSMRDNLSAINRHLASFRVSKPSSGGLVDLPPVRLVRIFNNGAFAHGGRFYGGVEGLPKEERRELLIDGEETVELDYSALHPRLMYALSGRPLSIDADPYAIAGWEGSRGAVKVAFQQLLNATPGADLRRPKEVPVGDLGGQSWGALLAALEAAHAPIAGWFRSCRGLELQRLDSDIAESVLLVMCGEGVPCFPIHDGFLVPSSAEAALRAAMSEAYREELAGQGASPSSPAIHA